MKKYKAMYESAKVENSRNYKKVQLLCQWMRLKQKNIELTEFFVDRNIMSVAIYGAGALGILLYKELMHRSELVKYILDKRADKLKLDEVEVPIYSLTNPAAFPVEVIIITPVLITDEIEDAILARFENQKVFEIEEVLYELCKKHRIALEMWE